MSTKPTWRTDAQNRPVGYFFFEADQKERTEDGENYIQFMTAASMDDAYDGHSPKAVVDRLNELFIPIFGEDRFEADAAEALHIVSECDPETHAKTMKTIREIFTKNGWTEAALSF